MAIWILNWNHFREQKKPKTQKLFFKEEVYLGMRCKLFFLAFIISIVIVNWKILSPHAYLQNGFTHLEGF